MLLLDLGEILLNLYFDFLFSSLFLSLVYFRQLIGLTCLINGKLGGFLPLVILANQTAAWLVKRERKKRLNFEILPILFAFASFSVLSGIIFARKITRL